jgi:Protein of unknown function (DUF2971)
MREDSSPMRLYRYVSFAQPFGHTTVENAILHHRLWWSSPVSFNDPFDCNPFLVFGENAAERQAYAKRMVREVDRSPRHIKRQNLRSVQAFARNHTKEALDAMWRGEMSKAAMVCMSALPDHPLMWAHYADSHRGAVLIFQEQFKPNFVALPVRYSPDRPLVNLSRLRSFETFQGAMLTKSEHWSYEEEFRLISTGEPVGFNDFPSEALVGVIFGARISIENRDFVLSLIARRPALKIWQASMHEREYRLDVLESN